MVEEKDSDYYKLHDLEKIYTEARGCLFMGCGEIP